MKPSIPPAALSSFLSILIVACATVDAWLLAQVGLNESYRVRHLSTHFSRVFLSISVESGTFPTLIESEWPVESFLPMRSIVFPNHEVHANGDHSDCSLLHQARWSQVDSLSRLWVFDAGWKDVDEECPPKLLAFDLIKNNAEVLRIDCSKYIRSIDSKLLVKLGPKLAPCQVERFIYFILDDEPYLLAYDILEHSWHRRKLISKKYKNVIDAFPVKPKDFAFGKQREHELIVSDADGSLYRSKEPHVLKKKTTNKKGAGKLGTVCHGPDDDIEMELLGSLLGPSRGMMIDQSGSLFYVVPKFGAIVRCEYKQNLTAEGNEIIYMTSKNIQQIFFGSKDSVWLLTDRLLKPQDHCLPGM